MNSRGFERAVLLLSIKFLKRSNKMEQGEYRPPIKLEHIWDKDKPTGDYWRATRVNEDDNPPSAEGESESDALFNLLKAEKLRSQMWNELVTAIMEYLLVTTVADKPLISKIALIKMIREITGLGLRECKTYIDSISS